MADMYYALRTLHMFGIAAPQLDWVQVVERVLELMGEDGAFADSPDDREFSARNTGRALATIAMALGSMDEDAKESVGDLVAGAADAANTVVAAAQESKNKSPKEDPKKEDPDPYGDAYENDAEPLEQAMKFVEPLQMHAAQYEETHLLAFEVFIRQGKPILALKAVNEALKINSESYQAKANVARLAHVVETMDEANAMKKVMAMQVGKLTENKSPAAFLDTLDSQMSPVSAAAVALAKYGVTGDAAALAVSAGSTSVDASRYSLAEYVEAHEMYATVSKAAADALKAACAGAFVHSTVFGGAKATVRTDA